MNNKTIDSLLIIVIIDFIINTFVTQGTLTTIVNVISLILVLIIVIILFFASRSKYNK